MSTEYSAGGKYRISTAPYQGGPLRDVDDPAVRTVVLMWASQLGKTEILMNVVGYHIDSDPAPILMVQPTITRAQEWSKERLAPTIRDTPALAARVNDPMRIDSDNTLFFKSFPGGNIAIAGANAPSGLAARPRRIVLLDEVDRFPASAGAEGDPIRLAMRRQDRFSNAFTFITSTPTIKYESRIENEYEETDQQQWFVVCPNCGENQTLKWRQVKWPDGNPAEAAYICEACRAELTDDDRREMVKSGEWRATAQFAGKRGYFLNGLYCLWPAQRGFKNRLHQMAVDFLDAKHGGDQTLKTWVNTFLAETWEHKTERKSPASIAARVEPYGPELPAGVLCLVGAADVQMDRLEYQVVGYGIGEEAWAIDYDIVWGNPHRLEPWAQLSALISREYTHVNGHRMRVAITFVDSGGVSGRVGFNRPVYRYVRSRQGVGYGMGVWACKGAGQKGAPLRKESRQTGHAEGRGVVLQMVGSDEAKSLFYSRLDIQESGPRYVHFPQSAKFDDEYFRQLTAEEVVITKRRGYTLREWKKVYDRNEVLDLWAYSLAALDKLNPKWQALAQRYGVRSEQGDETAQVEPRPVESPRPRPRLRHSPFRHSPFRRRGK